MHALFPLAGLETSRGIMIRDLPELVNLLNSTLSRPRRVVTWSALCIYFGIGGIAFDLLNPEVGFLTSVFGFITEDAARYPSHWIRLGPYFVAWNLGAAIAAIVFIARIRDPFLSGPLAGLAIASVGYFHYASELIGIITISWHAIFGAIVFGIILIGAIADEIWRDLIPLTRDLAEHSQIIESKELHERSIELRDRLWNVVRIVVEVFLGFAALTGVTMTILFGQGFSDVELKMTAIQMTSGFLISSIAIYLWIGLPLLGRIRLISAIDRIRPEVKYLVV